MPAFSHRCAVEVTTWWAGDVLDVRVVHPRRDFVVGADPAQVDFVMPSEAFGWSRAALVIGAQASPRISVPPGASGTIRRLGRPHGTLAEGDCVAAPPGTRARVELGQLAFAIHVGLPQPLAAAGRRDRSHDGLALFVSLSLLAHAGPLLAALFFAPALELDDGGLREVEGTARVARYLTVGAETQQPATAEVLAEGPDQGNGRCYLGRKLGSPAISAAGRYGVAGPRDNPDPHVASKTDTGDVAAAWALGASTVPYPNAPSAPWGRQDALGTDVVSARGSMWGDPVHDASGLGGMASSGTCGTCGGSSGGALHAQNPAAGDTPVVRSHRSPVTGRYPEPSEPPVL